MVPVIHNANPYGSEAYWRQLEQERIAHRESHIAHMNECQRNADVIQGELRTTLALQNAPAEYR